MKFKVKIDEQFYWVDVKDIHARPVLAEVNGTIYEVWPQEEPCAVRPAALPSDPVQPPADLGASRSQPPAPAVQGNALLSAPLPGVIVAINVKAGDSVKVGQELCVLEAMKMKNSIKSNRDGVIAQVHVNPGDLVRHNQPLFSFEA